MARCRPKQQHMVERHLQHHQLLQQHMRRSPWASCKRQSAACHQGQQPSLLLPLLTRPAPLLRRRQLPLWILWLRRIVEPRCRGHHP